MSQNICYGIAVIIGCVFFLDKGRVCAGVPPERCTRVPLQEHLQQQHGQHQQTQQLCQPADAADAGAAAAAAAAATEEQWRKRQ